MYTYIYIYLSLSLSLCLSPYLCTRTYTHAHISPYLSLQLSASSPPQHTLRCAACCCLSATSSSPQPFLAEKACVLYYYIDVYTVYRERYNMSIYIYIYICVCICVDIEILRSLGTPPAESAFRPFRRLPEARAARAGSGFRVSLWCLGFERLGMEFRAWGLWGFVYLQLLFMVFGAFCLKPQVNAPLTARRVESSVAVACVPM